MASIIRTVMPEFGAKGAGFAINNPNVSSACGCGHSFQVEEGAEGEMPAGGAGCGSGCG